MTIKSDPTPHEPTRDDLAQLVRAAPAVGTTTLNEWTFPKHAPDDAQICVEWFDEHGTMCKVYRADRQFLTMGDVRAAAPAVPPTNATTEELPSYVDVEERSMNWYAVIGPHDRRDGALATVHLIDKHLDIYRRCLRAAAPAVGTTTPNAQGAEYFAGSLEASCKCEPDQDSTCYWCRGADLVRRLAASATPPVRQPSADEVDGCDRLKYYAQKLREDASGDGGLAAQGAASVTERSSRTTRGVSRKG